jgi:hypothetical protein
MTDPRLHEARVQRCPTCGEPPRRTDRFGATLDPINVQVVERGTCKNGHVWWAADEKAAEGEDGPSK